MFKMISVTRHVYLVLATLLLTASWANAQSNTFTATKYASEGCVTVDKVTNAVSGLCTPNPDNNYVRVFMAPNSNTVFQYFQYSDSSCTVMVGAGTGRCGVCTGDKTIVTCPTSYSTTIAAPAFPTTADGYSQLTECYDASCSGSTCAVSLIKSGSCIGLKESSVPAIQTAAVTCSIQDGATIGQFTDATCKNAIATTNTKVLKCASKTASTSSVYTSYRRWDCATSNSGSLVITPPATGYKSTTYNSTDGSCTNSAISTTSLANGICVLSSSTTSEKIDCNGSGSVTVTLYDDTRCGNVVTSQSAPLTGSCSRGSIATCSSSSNSNGNSASSLVISAAHMVLVAAAALLIQLL